MAKKEVIVKYTSEDITIMLKNRLMVNDPTKFAELIVGHMSLSADGLSQLVKAMWDIYPSTKYCVGDHVYINKINLPTWRDIDIEKTLELPGNKDDLIVCVITDIDLYLEAPLSVEFKTVKKNGNIGSDTYYISDKSVVDVVENLSDVLSDIEDLNKDV